MSFGFEQWISLKNNESAQTSFLDMDVFTDYPCVRMQMTVIVEPLLYAGKPDIFQCCENIQ